MMQIQTIILFFLGAYALLLFTSCERDYVIPADVLIPDTVKFSADIIPIFNESCNISGCHTTGGGVAPDLTTKNAYSNLYMYGLIDTADAESSIVYLRMVSASNPMPTDGKLPEAKIKLVLEWIKQGAVDN